MGRADSQCSPRLKGEVGGPWCSVGGLARHAPDLVQTSRNSLFVSRGKGRREEELAGRVTM